MTGQIAHALERRGQTQGGDDHAQIGATGFCLASSFTHWSMTLDSRASISMSPSMTAWAASRFWFSNASPAPLIALRTSCAMRSRSSATALSSSLKITRICLPFKCFTYVNIGFGYNLSQVY